jgi:hypothetical protein
MYEITVEPNHVAAAVELDTRLDQFNEEQVGPGTRSPSYYLFAMPTAILWQVSSVRLSGMP